MDLSVVIPALREADNLGKLLPKLHQVVSGLEISRTSTGESTAPVGSKSRHFSGEALSRITYEIIVVDNHSPDSTAEVCAAQGAALVQQTTPGYGGALWAGFERATGEYILTMDADLSHVPDFVPAMWKHRNEAELVIASRYVQGGVAEMPWYRYVLSIILNVVYTKALALPVHDISSGFRLYRASVLPGLGLSSTDFDALEEILIKCYAMGCRIVEIPFRYVPRDEGKSKVKLLQFGMSYLRTLLRMWKLRHSIASADYDARAYDSVIPLQRYWQRRRYALVTDMVDNSRSCLDIGCGSSRILGALSEHTVGLDISLGKLRYSRSYHRPLINASAFALPFTDGAFEQIVCSQVIEHLPSSAQPFREIARALKNGGHLLLGTPDYGRWNWVVIERLYRYFAPDAYGDQHITHYDRAGLISILEGLGFRVLQTRYIWGAEMILFLNKTDGKS